MPSFKRSTRREFIAILAGSAVKLAAYSSFSSLLMSSVVRADDSGSDTITGLQAAFESSASAQDTSRIIAASDPTLASFVSAFNQRTEVQPVAIALCNSELAVSKAIAWAAENKVPFAVRGGGHSYEGFSQNSGLVIDMREMNSVVVDVATKTARIGAGAKLGQVYTQLTQHGFTIPAGSCPTVGIAGHVTGGGFGLLARKEGMACDSLRAIRIVNAHGKVLVANRLVNSDLFWACRGGSGGSFGIVTEFDFNLCPAPEVTVFGMGWEVSPEDAVPIFTEFQNFAPNAPNELTSILSIEAHSETLIALRFKGQFVGNEADFNTVLKPFLDSVLPTEVTSKNLTFIQAVKHFGGVYDPPPSVLMKAKSDYVKEPMTEEGIMALFNGLLALPPSSIAVICDSYGGKISEVPSDATAFFHRKGTLFCIQYYSQWPSASESAERLLAMENLYASMRPYVSGNSYVNYCDVDLKDWANAYFGANLTKLRQIKSKFDPGNFFQYAQSVPLAPIVPLRHLFPPKHPILRKKPAPLVKSAPLARK